MVHVYNDISVCNAIESGRESVVKFLINEGADIYNSRAMEWAKGGKKSIINLLKLYRTGYKCNIFNEKFLNKIKLRS